MLDLAVAEVAGGLLDLRLDGVEGDGVLRGLGRQRTKALQLLLDVLHVGVHLLELLVDGLDLGLHVSAGAQVGTD